MISEVLISGVQSFAPILQALCFAVSDAGAEAFSSVDAGAANSNDDNHSTSTSATTTYTTTTTIIAITNNINDT